MRALALLLVVACLALAATPSAASDASGCDATFAHSVDVGATRVHVLTERCVAQDASGTHAQRVVRVDVLRVDEAHPHGASHVASLSLLTSQSHAWDGSSTTRHALILDAPGGTNATLAYTAERPPAGAPGECGVTAGTRALGASVARVERGLPACAPRDAPLLP